MNYPGYHHLSWTDRLTIEKMRRIKTPVAQIAEALGYSKKTIYNELHRGEVTLLASDLTTYQTYSPDIAEKKYREMLRGKHRDLAIGHDHAQVRELERLIKDEHWSPAPALAACSGRFTARISISTLYNYIYRGDVFLRLTPSDLHDKGRRRRRHHDDRPARPPRGTSIEKRPEEIGQRGTFGHWEMDSVMGKVGSTRALLVLTERLTRTGIMRLLPDHTSASVVRALDEIERDWGDSFSRVFRSITMDNGCEFQDAVGLERSCRRRGPRTQLYYCHPSCPHERGSNENYNRMIRRFLPKGVDMDTVTTEQVAQAEHWINNYPRAILDYRASADLFAEEVGII